MAFVNMPKSEFDHKTNSIMPCHIALEDDLESFEIAGLGSVTSIAKAHRELLPPPWLLRAVPKKRFPANVELTGLGALSDALVGKLTWDSPRVWAEATIMLGSNSDNIMKFIEQWRERAVREVVYCFQVVKHTEQMLFGEASYFKNKDAHPGERYDQTQGSPDPAPEFDMLAFTKFCA